MVLANKLDALFTQATTLGPGEALNEARERNTPLGARKERDVARLFFVQMVLANKLDALFTQTTTLEPGEALNEARVRNTPLGARNERNVARLFIL